MDATVISSDSEVKKCETGHGRGWNMGGKEKWGMGKRNKKRRRNGKSINLFGRLVTEILTKSCMVAYECNV